MKIILILKPYFRQKNDQKRLAIILKKDYNGVVEFALKQTKK
jgi:hypothetical protein